MTKIIIPDVPKAPYCMFCGNKTELKKTRRFDVKSGEPIYDFKCMMFGCVASAICDDNGHRLGSIFKTGNQCIRCGDHLDACC